MSDDSTQRVPPYPSPGSGQAGALIGKRLGNYTLVSLLGSGAFADVYLGEHLELGTQAAIKVLAIRLASEDEIEDFRTEARTIARLDHPNIIRILDFGSQEGIVFLVMDYAPNGTLRSRHPKGVQLSPTTILPYIKQVAEALQYAHDEKLIHRDIKPENMLLGRHNQVLLSDFGIALVSHTSDFRSTSLQVAGTIAYMAPEQINGHPHPASDQYALGIVVYEWLCGERPFQGSFTEMAARHLLAAPPRIRDKAPGIPQGLEVVVMTALAKEPKERFASVRAFARAFEEAYNLTVQAPPSLFLPGISPTPGPTTSASSLSTNEGQDILNASTVFFASPTPSEVLLPHATLPTIQASLPPSSPVEKAAIAPAFLPPPDSKVTKAFQSVQALRQEIQSLKDQSHLSLPAIPPSISGAGTVERLLEEIQTLHQEIQQIKEATITPPPASTLTESATIATIVQELQILRREIQEIKEATLAPPPSPVWTPQSPDAAQPKEPVSPAQAFAPGGQTEQATAPESPEAPPLDTPVNQDKSALGDTMPESRRRAFISYCYADRRHLTRLKTQLAPFAKHGMVDYWDETQLIPGTNWRKEIERAINFAKVAVLLISADFLASKFITENVLPPLLVAAQRGGASILPVIISPCVFEETDLAQFHVVNDPPDRPLIAMTIHQREMLWKNLATLIALQKWQPKERP